MVLKLSKRKYSIHKMVKVAGKLIGTIITLNLASEIVKQTKKLKPNKEYKLPNKLKKELGI